jgi:hypothetical protein
MDVQVELSELVDVFQRLFPKEYTIAIQTCHIAKLNALLEEKEEVKEVVEE